MILRSILRWLCPRRPATPAPAWSAWPPLRPERLVYGLSLSAHPQVTPWTSGREAALSPTPRRRRRRHSGVSV